LKDGEEIMPQDRGGSRERPVPQDSHSSRYRPPARTDDDQLAREIRAHLELEAEERIADGEPPAEAHYAARRAFGNVTLIREDARAVWIAPWLDHLGQDLRYAARRLTRMPGFAVSAVLILVAGIGLNLTFFHLLNVMVLRPLPVADLDTLVRFDRVSRRFSSNGIPYPATQFIRQHNTVLTAVLTSSATDVVWADDPNDRVDALYVSANWFSELGHHAALGRVFSNAIDEAPGADPAVIVSHDFWLTRLHGEPVAGRAVRINDRPATVIGVAPEGFTGLRLSDTKVWLLINQIDYFNSGSAFKDDWSAHSTQLYGRLAPGITGAAARDGLQGTLRELGRLRPHDFEPDEALIPSPGRDGFRTQRDRDKLRTMVVLVGGLMLLVFVVACANLSNLILSQAVSRLREFSVRAALGATRWRVLRQQLVESAVITVAGTLGGLLFGQWCARLMAVQIDMPSYVRFSPDWRIAGAACAIALAATVAIGLVPAWMVSRRDLVAAMKDGGHQASSRLSRTRFRLFSIGSQVTGCCVLLVVAGSTLRGFQRVVNADLGFEFRQVAAVEPSLSRYGIANESAGAYWREVKRTLQGLPDVEHLALASHAPLAGSANRSVYNDAPRLSITNTAVEPEFFPLLRIPILAGRNFNAADDPRTAVIVSRRLAVEMYGSVDAVGKGFPRSNPERTIVGVAADAALVHVAATNVAELYLPVDQDQSGGLVLLASARTDPQRLLAPMRDAARLADPRVLPRTWLPTAQFDARVQGRRVASLIASATGLLALGLACFGIFGLVAYASTMRMHEIGIRRALGANSVSVVVLLLRHLAIPVGLGMALGTAVGVSVGRVLEGEPFYLPAATVDIPAIALIVLGLTAALAALVPALRALRLDPLTALRHE
jgi:predicted permease